MADPGDLWGERDRPRPRQLLFDVLTAVGFTLLGLAVAVQQGTLAVVATVVMGLALAVRRLSWPAMALLATAAGVCQVVGGELVLLADVGYAGVFFVLGAHPRSAVRRFGLAGALGSAAVLATMVGFESVDAVSGVSTAFAVAGSAALAALISGGGWAAGYVRWQTRARITAQVQAGLEQERTRIAADMHDLVAHTWAVVAAQADGARYSLGSAEGDRKTADALDVIAETARGSIADLRRLLAELRYEESGTPPGRGAREALVERMRASGMDVRQAEHGTPSGSPLLAVTAQRLLAEALTNALKHGDLSEPVEIEEDWRAGYRLVVRNRVRDSSEAPPAASLGTGHGLAGMRERVELAGGTFEAGASNGTWTVGAELPEPAP